MCYVLVPHGIVYVVINLTSMYSNVWMPHGLPIVTNVINMCANAWVPHDMFVMIDLINICPNV